MKVTCNFHPPSLIAFILLFASLNFGQAQPIPFKFSPEDYQKFTSEYQGERFPDGRPKVSSDILERMKLVTVEEAWGILRSHGYNNQFEQDWVMTHENPVLVGRAVTIGFLPNRPDISDVVAKEGADLVLPQGALS